MTQYSKASPFGGSGGGSSSPVTTRGDIIRGDASGVDERLAIGTSGYVLTSDGTDAAWAANAGAGDVVGPGAATNNAVARYDTTTGKLLQDSAVTIADTSGNMAGVGTLNTHTIQGGTGTLALTSDITGTNSGTNTGDQTITLTGGVTGSGTGSFAATVITNANLTGGVTSVGNAATVITNANLTGGVTSVGNAATVVTNANLTGHITSVGNAAVLGSFSSLQLKTALSDETGSGLAVFATSPTLTTPLITTGGSLDVTGAGSLTIAASAGANNITLGGSTSTVVVAGNLTVSGTTTTLNTANLDVEDANITVNNGGDQSSANDVAGLTVEMSDATDHKLEYSSSAASGWRMGAGTLDAGDDVPTTSSTDTFTNKTLTSPNINEAVALTSTSTELNYVDGVTSSIQTQLDAKVATVTTTRGDFIRRGVSADERVSGVTDNQVLAGDGTDLVSKQIDDPAFFTTGAAAGASAIGIVTIEAQTFAGTKTFVAPVLGAAVATSINLGDTTLAAFKEGTWTPVATIGGTGLSSSATGYYQRTGSWVHAQCTVSNMVVDGNTGAFTVTGLPYATTIETPGTLRVRSITFATTDIIVATVGSSSTTFSFVKMQTGSNGAAVDEGDLHATLGDVYIQISYRTADAV